ncbi:MAG: histidine kinase, partial [Ilumatobacteraceae bacterium]
RDAEDRMRSAAALARMGAAAIVAAALAAGLAPSGGNTVSTLTAMSALVVAGAGVWLTPAIPAFRVGLLTPAGVLLGIAASADGPLTSTGHASARVAGLVVLALVSASLVDRRVGRATALLGGIVGAVAYLLLYDPFLDLSCRGCGHAAFAVWADPGRAEVVWWSAVVLLVMAAVVGLVERRFETVPVLVATVAFGIDPGRVWLLAVAVAVASVFWARRCWAVRRRHLAVRRILAVHEPSGGLASVLRRLTGDPTIEITFPAADGSMFVDADGLRVCTRPGRAATDVSIHGEVLARVAHFPSTKIPDFSVGLDPEIVLELHTERLNAQLAARVDDLARERLRLVQAGLAERRALERDLHDGVQQELLALGLDLRLSLATVPARSVDEPVLQEALRLVHDCVDQVRVISTGVSPPMLETRGLRAAVSALVRRRGDFSDVTVDLDRLPAERLRDDLERAAYSVLAEGLALGATTLRAALVDGELIVSANGTNTRRHADGTLGDLIAAVGGSLQSTDSGIEAVIPCA